RERRDPLLQSDRLLRARRALAPDGSGRSRHRSRSGPVARDPDGDREASRQHPGVAQDRAAVSWRPARPAISDAVTDIVPFRQHENTKTRKRETRKREITPESLFRGFVFSWFRGFV